VASDAEAAIDRLRVAVGAGGADPGRAWPVYDPDGEQPLYFLVELGPPAAVIAVGAVDARTGEVMSHARLPGSRSHLAVDAEDAKRIAGMPAGAHARLVWRPSRQSASPLYPLWQVRHGTKAGYVDLGGRVTPQLDPGGPG
jgi:hypothetical protein